MNYAAIKPLDIANGEGIRVSLFVSGCTHRCKGCFNSPAWDFNYGSPYTESVEREIAKLVECKYVSEPFEPPNQRALLSLVKRVAAMDGKNIWAYTGYTYESDLLKGGRAHCEATDEILDSIDVLVDGEYVESLKDISLPFCGSSNQRVLDMRAIRGCRDKNILWRKSM